MSAAAKMRVMVKDFVAQLMNGRDLGIVLEDGSVNVCKVSMTQDLQQMLIQVFPEVHTVEVKHIEHMFRGRDCANIWTSLPLDQACLTMVLKGTECVTLRFDDETEPKIFLQCMNIIRLTEMERR